ncbi:MAG: type II toxin-antitoxin system HicA family toxin [Chthoniobacteraceae bacterium]
MKLPRDVSATQLIKALRKLGYEVSRQRGSHIRITTQRDGEHHEVVPNHSPLKPGTFSSILKGVALHHGMTPDALLQLLDL